MISLSDLAALAAAYPDDLDRPVAPIRLGDRVIDTDVRPAVMGVVNLSQDSYYRDSVAPTTETAIRMGRVQALQGADIVDLGAESSVTGTARVDDEHQIRGLVPVIEALAADDIAVSVESYAVAVVRAGLAAGARVINLTGSDQDDAMFDLAAEFGATVVLNYVPGANVREVADAGVGTDRIPVLLQQFETRVARAGSHGVDRIVLDPGLGFSYRDLDEDPAIRTRHQGSVLLQTFRLRRLGLPVCHALPHAFHHFQDQFRSAEGYFAVLAALGGTGLLRTHEVPQIVGVLNALGDLRAT